MASPTPSPAGSPTSDEKTMATIAYLGPAILMLPTLVIYLLKKDESQFIKFHCLQNFGLALAGIILSILLTIISGILGFIPVLGWILGIILMMAWCCLGLAFLVYYVYLIMKTVQGEEIEVPYLGSYIKQNLMN